MIRPSIGCPKSRQGGIAVLIVVTAMAALVAAVFVFGVFAGRGARTEEHGALSQAKQALIGYAVTYADAHPYAAPGYFPCPDQGTPEGTAAPSCGTKDVSNLGKLPWKSLGTPALTDSDGECLWYAVSGSYKNNPKTDLLNWDTPGQFEVLGTGGTVKLAGATPESRAVAVIFSPGASIGQDRTPAPGTDRCRGNYTAANYLDTDTTTGINNSVVNPGARAVTQFIVTTDSRYTATDTDAFNDRAAYITPQEIFARMEARPSFGAGLKKLLHKTAECIAQFGVNNGNHLPWAAPLALVDFGQNSSYDDLPSQYAGRVAWRVNDSKMMPMSIVGTSLLTTTNCPGGWNEVDDWFQNWKDQIFYAVSTGFAPSSPMPACAPSCFKVNGAGSFAAVVIFSGKRLTGVGQQRSSDTLKGIASNYLEDANLSLISANAGSGDFKRAPASATFDDDIVCIKPDMTVDDTCSP
jgi:hypothetical protein